MTDKEQVIIDGCDVSECEYVCNTAFGNIGCKLPFNEEIHCCNIPNCYFKQLARKTQENEELENKIKKLRKNLALEIEANYRYCKALEEIEQELKEDIYCESQECGCDDFEECLRCTKNKILDIINKAKGGNNENT